MDKEYQAELLVDVWTVMFFLLSKGLPVLEVCVNDLVKYLDSLQFNHDYAYYRLCTDVC